MRLAKWQRTATTHPRGIAMITVLFATVLLLVLVAVLVDLGTVALKRSTAELRALQATAGADAGTGWVRGILEIQKGDIAATVARLGTMQGKKRFVIDDHTYVVASVLILAPSTPAPGGDHVDANLEQEPQVVEQPAQVQSSATVYADGVAAGHRTTTTLLRVFPAAPYSAVVGVIDDGGPVGIYSPGDAGGQSGGKNVTELLVHAYITVNGQRQDVSDWSPLQWNDGNSQGGGPLP